MIDSRPAGVRGGLPTLSAVICNYNHGRYLGVAVRAMLAQSHQPDELIVLDDASTDDSVAVVRSIMHGSPLVRLVQNETRAGIFENCRRATRLASSEYVYFGGADDYVLPGFFERAIRLLATHRSAGLFTAGGILIDEQGTPTGKVSLTFRGSGFIEPIGFAKELRKRPEGLVFGSSTIYKREALMEAGGLDDKLGPLCDTVLDHAIAIKHGLCYDDGDLSAFRRTRQNFSMVERSWHEIAEYTGRAAAWLRDPVNHAMFPASYIRFFDREAAHARRRAYLADMQVAADRLIEDLTASGSDSRLINQFGRMALLLGRCGLALSIVAIRVELQRRRLTRHLIASVINRRSGPRQHR